MINKYDRQLMDIDQGLLKIKESDKPLLVVWILCVLLWAGGFFFGWIYLGIFDWKSLIGVGIYPLVIWGCLMWRKRTLKKLHVEVQKAWVIEEKRMSDEYDEEMRLRREAEAKEIREANEKYYSDFLSRKQKLRDSFE